MDVRANRPTTQFEKLLNNFPAQNYLTTLESGGISVLYHRQDLPGDSNTSQQMDEGLARREIQSANDKLISALGQKFGVTFTPKLFDETAALAGVAVTFDALKTTGALKIHEAKEIFTHAETVVTAARNKEINQQAIRKQATQSTNSSATDASASATTATTTSTTTTTITATTTGTTGSTATAVQAAEFNNIEGIISQCTFVADKTRTKPESGLITAMKDVQVKLADTIDFEKLGTEKKKAALKRAAEGELIKHDIRAQRPHLQQAEVAALNFLINRAFRQPELAMLHELSSKELHSLLLTGDLAKLKDIYDKKGPDAIAFLARAPKGMMIDDKGISGHQQVTFAPARTFRRLTDFPGRSLVDVIKFSVEKNTENLATLTGTTITFLVPKEDEEQEDLPGFVLPSLAVADFGRMNYQIAKKETDEPELWQKSFPTSTNIHKHNDAANFVGKQIYKLAGNDSTTAYVLASALTQGSLTSLADFIATHSGDGIECLGGDRGLTGAVWTVTKNGAGDFKIGIEVPIALKIAPPGFSNDPGAKAAAQKFQSGLDMMAGTTNAGIRAKFELTVIVNAAEAAKGNVAVSVPGGMTITFHNPI